MMYTVGATPCGRPVLTLMVYGGEIEYGHPHGGTHGRDRIIAVVVDCVGATPCGRPVLMLVVQSSPAHEGRALVNASIDNIGTDINMIRMGRSGD